jgi:transposase InsO family protein
LAREAKSSDSIPKYSYLLPVRDDFSGKAEFFDTTIADAPEAADAIMWWRARFGLRLDATIVTDGGSHFANSLVRELTKKLKVQHHITVAYSPWANGKAERLNREILRVLRILLSELKLPQHTDQWKMLLPSVQYCLNNTPRKRLAGKSADEVFLAVKATTPLEFIVVDKVEYTTRSIPLTKKEILESLDHLDQALQETHRDVIDVQTAVRNVYENKRGPLDLDYLQFAVGDWVMVSCPTKPPNKLYSYWSGPFQIVDVFKQFCLSC